MRGKGKKIHFMSHKALGTLVFMFAFENKLTACIHTAVMVVNILVIS